MLGALLAGCAPQTVATGPQAPQPPAVVAQPAVPVPAPPPAAVPPLAAAPPTLGVPADGKIRVALLLPLSGPDAAVGRALEDAAEMAVFDFADEHLLLLPIDTGGPSGAAGAAQQAINGGARLILGPIFARSVSEVAPVARGAHVPVLSFSSDRRVAGDGIYTMGLPPSAPFARVVGYAHGAGIARFAALLPANEFGQRIGDGVRRAIEDTGGTLVRSETFDPGGSDLQPAVKRVTDIDRRQPGGKGPIADPDIQALILAEVGPRLQQITPLLASFGIDPAKVRMIGPPLWQDPAVLRDPALLGAWFAAPDPAGRAAFERRYQQAYGQPAPALATLAYDAAGLAAVLVRLNPATDFGPSVLNSPDGFAGVDGIFRFDPNGVIERGLAVMQADPKGATVVSPAPTSFAGE